MLASVGLPRIAAGAEYACRMVNPGRRVALGPAFHGDLEFWYWFVSKGLDALGGGLSTPMYHLLERPAQRTLFFGYFENRLRFFFVSRPGFTGGTTLASNSSHVSAVPVGLTSVWTTFQSTFSSFWAWSFRRGSSFLRAWNVRLRRVIVFCSVGTATPPCSRFDGVAAERNCGRVRSCALLACSNCPLGGISMRNTCGEYLMRRPMESHAGIAPPSLCASVLAPDSCEAPLRPRLNALIRGIFAHG